MVLVNPGYNSHIKSLNINYEPMAATAILNTNARYGKVGFQQVGNQGQKISDVENVANGPPTTTDYAPQLLPGDPIFFAMETAEKKKNNQAQKTEDKDPIAATKLYGESQEYFTTLSYAHFLSSLNTTITVRGNPNIIAKYADVVQRGGVPPHFKIVTGPELSSLVSQANKTSADKFNDTLKAKVQSAKDMYYNQFIAPRIKGPGNISTTDALQAGGNIVSSPVYVKINIKSPDTEYTGDFKQGKPMYTDEFFYNGLYMVMIVTTTFTNGDFEHQMQLNPWPAVKLNSDTTSTPIKKTI